jgi:hypothetical protein
MSSKENLYGCEIVIASKNTLIKGSYSMKYVLYAIDTLEALCMVREKIDKCYKLRETFPKEMYISQINIYKLKDDEGIIEILGDHKYIIEQDGFSKLNIIDRIYHCKLYVSYKEYMEFEFVYDENKKAIARRPSFHITENNEAYITLISNPSSRTEYGEANILYSGYCKHKMNSRGICTPFYCERYACNIIDDICKMDSIFGIVLYEYHDEEKGFRTMTFSPYNNLGDTIINYDSE